MKILSPPDLHYPITVGELAKRRDDDVERSEQLFTYVYESTVEEGNKWGEKRDVIKKFVAPFTASVQGKIIKWFINQGSVIPRSG